MTIEQLNYLLRKELYAIKNHKDNIDRIKKEYFDSNYGLKEGGKIRILRSSVKPLLLSRGSMLLLIIYVFFNN